MSNETMKVHSTCIRDRTLKNVPESVPMSMLNEDWAKRNHDQSLDTLNSRGGLGITELLANIHKTKVRHGIEKQHDVDELNELIQKHISMNTTPTTKAKPTAGPVKKVYAKDEHGIYIASNTGAICRIPMWATGAEADADFILESYTVYHETKLTPRELVERIKQMKEAFALLGEKLVNMPETLEKQDCYSIINKATE